MGHRRVARFVRSFGGPLALVLGASTLSCTARSSSAARTTDVFGTAEVLIVAPHPDDEAIMTAGVIAREHAAGRRVAVALVTNGDLTCERDGIRREGETVAAMKHLGLREEDVFFLGYPDGHLEELGHVALEPQPRRDRTGRCVRKNTTYAARGAGGTDVHSLLTGAPAVYTSDSLTFDLAALITHLRPRDIYVSHPIDEHPDHAFAYTYVRRALEVVMMPGLAPPRLHRALVHIGGCWPTAPGLPPCSAVAFVPGAEPPLLPPPLDVYRPAELLPVPEAMRLADPDDNPKFMAIAEYRSQTGPIGNELSYLFSFARAREPFFPETLAADGDGRLRRAATLRRGAVSNEGPWHVVGAMARRELEQRAPLRCRVSDAEAESALEMLHGAEGHYALRTTATELVVEHVRASGAASVLRRWVLPRHAGADASHHTLEMTVDVRADDGGVGEITVRRDGEVLGVAVDPRPLVQGTSVALSRGPGEMVCEPF